MNWHSAMRIALAGLEGAGIGTVVWLLTRLAARRGWIEKRGKLVSLSDGFSRNVTK